MNEEGREKPGCSDLQGSFLDKIRELMEEQQKDTG